MWRCSRWRSRRAPPVRERAPLEAPRPGPPASTPTGRAGHISFGVRTERRPARRRGPAGGARRRASSRRCCSWPTCGARGPAAAAAPGDRALLGPMIRRSDNAAASRGAQHRGQRRARAARAAARACALPARRRLGPLVASTRPTRRASSSTSSGSCLAGTGATRCACSARSCRAQRWGIARVRPRGWALYFKGGWGSGSGLCRPPGGAAPPRPAAALGGDPDHLEPEPRVREARRCAAWRRGCCDGPRPRDRGYPATAEARSASSRPERSRPLGPASSATSGTTRIGSSTSRPSARPPGCDARPSRRRRHDRVEDLDGSSASRGCARLSAARASARRSGRAALRRSAARGPAAATSIRNTRASAGSAASQRR